MRAKAVQFCSSAGLAKDVKRQRIEVGFFGAAIANSSAHSFDNHIPIAIFDFEVRPHRWYKACRPREAGSEEVTTIDQGRVGIDDLNRSRLKIVALTDCILRTPIVALKLTRQFLVGIDTAFSAETKFAKRPGKTRFGKAFTQGAEVVVTGISDGLSRIQRRQVPRMRACNLKCVVRILFMAESA